VRPRPILSSPVSPATTWTDSLPNWQNPCTQPGKDACTADAVTATDTAGPRRASGYPDLPRPTAAHPHLAVPGPTASSSRHWRVGRPQYARSGPNGEVWTAPRGGQAWAAGAGQAAMTSASRPDPQADLDLFPSASEDALTEGHITLGQTKKRLRPHRARTGDGIHKLRTDRLFVYDGAGVGWHECGGGSGMAGRAVGVAPQRLHQSPGDGDAGLLLLINGTLVGVGGVFLATASVVVTGIAAAAAVALAMVVTSADR
jgi:hypothetical protein